MTKIAIMQPYIFPYIGYFHLIHSSDKFVFLDDVNYINRGWINRNRIISPDKMSDYLFTIPLAGASQNKKINEISLHENYTKWRETFRKTFDAGYHTAPYYQQAKSLVFNLLDSVKPGDLISGLARNSIKDCAKYLGINPNWIDSSTTYNNSELKKGARLIDICKREGAEHYINAIGGQELYTKEVFAAENVMLSFVKSSINTYREPFLPGLSIIDLIAHCSPETLQQQIISYHLV